MHMNKSTHTPGVILPSAAHKRGHVSLRESEGALRHCYGLQASYKHQEVGLWVWTGMTHTYTHTADPRKELLPANKNLIEVTNIHVYLNGISP